MKRNASCFTSFSLVFGKQTNLFYFISHRFDFFRYFASTCFKTNIKKILLVFFDLFVSKMFFRYFAVTFLLKTLFFANSLWLFLLQNTFFAISYVLFCLAFKKHKHYNRIGFWNASKERYAAGAASFWWSRSRNTIRLRQLWLIFNIDRFSKCHKLQQ
jgi:hypothetical protein